MNILPDISYFNLTYFDTKAEDFVKYLLFVEWLEE